MLRRLRDEQPAGSVLIPNPDPVDEVELFGIRYRAGDVRGFHYAMEPADVRELLESIERARYCADYVVLSMHSHEPGNWSEVPADFFTVLARQAIDHGADVITGHGPHRLRGIEIYRNRPIFYSLGNFICQAALLDPMVADKYEQHRQWDSAVSDELAALWLSLIVDDVWYQSVLATTRFLDRKMTEIQLTPLELRSDAAGGVRGVPRVARDKKASTILRTLQRLSNCLGTRLCIQNDLGFIHPIAGDPPSRPR